MFFLISDIGYLMRALFVLARYDALVPREFADMLPWPIRILGHVSRFGAKGGGLRPGQRLARALGGEGPAYVKFGQVLATRADIIGFEMADDLTELQDRMPAFATRAAIAEVEKTFGAPLSAYFTSFSEPIAAASIAQVHKAQLHDGREVAVKILRPRIERQVTRELRAFLLGARIVERFVKASKRLEPVKFINALRAAALLELDLRMEAGAASELAENLTYNTMIRIPKIEWELSDKRILTLEWVEGVRVTDIPELMARNVDRQSLAKVIMRSFLSQALNDGFFHADMHQGNMLIEADGKLVLIDFGIMGRLDANHRRYFAQIIYGFIQRDYKAAAKAHFEAGWVPAHQNVDAFATALRAVGEPIFGQEATSIDMSRVLRQLFDITDIFDMHLRSELVLLQRTMVVVEGVARALDPDINMWETARPVVADYVSSLIGPRGAARSMREGGRAAMRLATRFPEFADLAERLVSLAHKTDDTEIEATLKDIIQTIKK